MIEYYQNKIPTKTQGKRNDGDTEQQESKR